MVRRMKLAGNWYPREAAEADAFVTAAGANVAERDAEGAVAPHAGWRYSGALAARVIGRLRPAVTVVVLGGHRGFEDRVSTDGASAYETPFGVVPVDNELHGFLDEEVGFELDAAVDNTVEVPLPLVHRLVGPSALVCLRVPPSHKAAELGRALSAAVDRGRDLVVLGSTDLTHYGPNYGFCPHGTGSDAEVWARDVNDARFVDALVGLDVEGILARGRDDRAACSSGAAAAVAAFARLRGLRAEVMGYASSLDQRRDDSFVGYCGVVFLPDDAF